ncbi:DUF1801 domain-containing protein [Prauserella cavernicola]|uniref:DUF1801 domain-containing protein n=1 Tax=Prauserella cavernicola TaxID=2800127 RepID=A0A934QUA9_9PSEU|nr:DUF1801 domain-containing protein [Prauserella cavernicola]MBK1785474.1 DUF1801 domain-containing protein [Prauserella cavernicola]
MARFETVEAYVGSLAEPLREVAEKLLPVIRAALPEANEAVWHGHPVWSAGGAPGRDPVCLIKGYATHLTFSLWRGRSVTDPSGRLENGAREMAGVKLRGLADLDEALFTGWLEQARDLY